MSKSNTELENIEIFDISEKTKKERKAWRNPDGSVYSRPEKVRSASGRQKTQLVWYARKRYFKPAIDEDGRKLTDDRGEIVYRQAEKKRRCQTQDEALSALARIKQEIDEELRLQEQPPEKTFFELVELYQNEYATPAKYVGEQKASGLRERQSIIRQQLAIFKDFFGDVPLSKIKYTDIKRFKETRQNTNVVKKINHKVQLSPEELASRSPKSRQRVRKEKRERITERKPATVHRELARLRRLFSIAVHQGWIDVNPFLQGDALIIQSIETERIRVLSFTEEKQLLKACRDEKTRWHLIPLIICAVDTAMRQGELYSMQWRQVDLKHKIIRIPTLATKTLRWRIAPMTERLKEELENLQNTGGVKIGLDDLVFLFGDVKRSWRSACQKAGLMGLRFHDLRATAITRMLEAGRSPAEVMKISGHTQMRTFLRYVRQDMENAQRAGDALDDYLNRHIAPNNAPDG